MNRSCLLPALSILIFLLSPTIDAGPAVLDPEDPLPIRGGTPEQIDGVTTFYRSVSVDPDTRLRILVTRPDNEESELYPLFFTQWVSCGDLRYRRGRSDSETFALLARSSGLSLVRVERSGSGDSSGVPCSELDYDTELAHYEQAFAAVLESGLVDPSRLFFYGSSLGSTTAPLIARRFQERGHSLGAIAVQGGGAHSYLERMLAFEQHYLDRRAAPSGEQDRTASYQQRASFLVEYLVRGRHPDAIAADSEAMREVRDDILGMDETHHYGRPYRWHQQAAGYDLVAAWAAIRAPVLVIYNEYDQYESLYGAQLLVDAVERSDGGSATLVQQQGLGHSSWAYPDARSAYADEGGVSAWPVTAGRLVAWFKSQLAGLDAR